MQDRDSEFEPEKPLERWESELLEIIEASDRDSTLSERTRDLASNVKYKTRPSFEERTRDTRRRLSVGALLLIVLMLAVVGFSLRHVSPFLGQMLAFAALVAFVALLYKALFGNRGPDPGTPSSLGQGPGSESNPTIQAWKNRIRRDE